MKPHTEPEEESLFIQGDRQNKTKAALEREPGCHKSDVLRASRFNLR